MTDIRHKIKDAKQRLLQMHFESKVGHIGGNLSALDAMMVLHHEIMQPEDTFILSKGHSAGALYITLWSKGRISDEELKTFHKDGTKLAGHPVPGWIPEIPVATGSLGHGLPVAVGIALGRKLAGQAGHIYCLTSDGEWQEGSNWEALIFIAHHHLSNLTILVDNNGLQGFGSTKEVASMDNLFDKMAAFNIKITQANGHSPEEIKQALHKIPAGVVILNTIKGSGVSFMEDRMEWHYLPLKDSQFELALTEIASL